MTLEELDALRRTLLLGASRRDATVALQLEWIALIGETIKRIERTRALIAQLDELLRPSLDVAGSRREQSMYNLLEIRQFNATASIYLARHVASAFSLRRGTSNRVAATRDAIATSEALMISINAFIGGSGCGGGL